MSVSDEASRSSRNLTIYADDGYALSAQYFHSPTDPQGLVIINSATGTPRRYYRRFAEFLSEDGFDVVTYDYRGIGESAPANLRGFQAQMRDWGQKDFPAVIKWCREHRPTTPILGVGHSVGGQILGLAPNNESVDAMLFVCCQHTWWGHWPRSHWPRLHLMWSVLLPGLSHAMGYFPASWLGMGEALPKGVALEWAAWAKAKGYTPEVIGPGVQSGYDRYDGEILSLSFEDDTFAPHRAASALLDVFPSAKREHRHLDPKPEGFQVGHFGYFRPQFRDTLWPEARYWLKRRIAPAS
jgi:predicted alpha/beta hydrolase